MESNRYNFKHNVILVVGNTYKFPLIQAYIIIMKSLTEIKIDKGENNMKAKSKLWFVLILGLVLILGACGNSETPESQSNDNNQTGETDTTTDDSSTSGDSNSDTSKDTLVIGLDDDPPQLDPHLSSAAVDRQTYQSLYNKLLDIDENLNIIPELAKSWVASSDGKTYTFELEQGVLFHDGEPFNAEAVKFNFERMLDPDLGSPRRAEVNLIEEINVVGEYTVEVKLSAASSPFLSGLTDRAGMMVSPKAVKELGDDFSNQPVGTGPFKFSERVRSSHIELVKFDDYWRDLPEFDKVIIRPYSDENVRVTNLISGELDIINRIAFKDIESLKNNSDITLSQVDSLGFQGIHFNIEKAPFNNKKLRQAINYAIDRKAIAKVVFHDGVIPAVGGISPVSWAYTNFESGDRDLEKAKQLLQESGAENVSFTLTMAPRPTEELIAQMVQNMLGEIGITVEIEMVEFGTILEKLANSDFDAVRLGWSGRIDPDGNLYRFYKTGANNNYTGFSNERVDELLELGRTESDTQERIKIYEEINQIIWDEAPYINLYHEIDFKAYKSNVNGFKHIADGMIRTETITFK